MAKIGYARVSTRGQDLAAQVARLEDAGCEAVYADTYTGTRDSRPEWDACRKALRSGDTLVITRLDRMGRSLKNLLEISAWLDKKGVSLMVLDQQIDTSTSTGRLMFQMLGVVAEFEATLVSERTQKAMAARPRGKSGGRPKVMTPQKLERANDLRDKGIKTSEIAKILDVGEATLYRAWAGQREVSNIETVGSRAGASERK